jgi:putative peptidoglycan lipid II flippase
LAEDVGKGFRILSLLTLASRVLGMARDHILARVFGTSVAMNAFGVAFSLPNLFRRLFGEGALSAAFLPVFTSLVEDKDERGAQRLANLTITLLVVGLASLTLMGEGVILILGAVLEATPRLQLTLGLSAVMLPFVVTICLVALLQAILNVRGHFATPAMAPIVLNIFIIAGALCSAPLWGENIEWRIYGVATAILVAGLVQVAIQVPTLRRHGFRFRLAWDTASPGMRRVLKLMLPMIVGLGIVQLNTFVDLLIAMGLSSHEAADGTLVTHFDLWGHSIAYPLKQNAVSVMYFSQRLYQLPMGVFTIALGTAIFPALARHAHHKDHAGLAGTLNRGLRMATFIALPCAVGMILVAWPLVRVILQHGEFANSATATTDVAWMTAVYVSGLVSYSVLHLATRTFFAYQDAMTPVKTAVAAAAVNFALNLSLIWVLGINGLALSTVIAATGQTAVLVWLLRKKVGPLGGRRYLDSLGRCVVATVLMAAAAWGALKGTEAAGLDPSHWTDAAVQLAAAIGAGVVAYLLAARLLAMRELGEVLGRRRGK